MKVTAPRANAKNGNGSFAVRSEIHIKHVNHSTFPLICELIQSYNKIQYHRAAQHFEGTGFETGVDWNATLPLVRALRKKQLISEFSAIETLLAGACWPQTRVSEVYPDVPDTCQLYKLHPGTSKHTFCECNVINNLDDDNIVETAYLIPKACAEADSCPCLWLRGILPHNLTQVPDDKNNIVYEPHYQYDLNMPPIGEWESGTYFGDGTGGKDTSYPTLRRCGVGVSRMSAIQVKWTPATTYHGEQTVW